MKTESVVRAKAGDEDLKDLFGIVRPVLESVRPKEFIEAKALLQRADALEVVFERDRARLEPCAELLFGADIEHYGRDAASLFQKWEQEGGGPALPAMLAVAIEAFDLDPDSLLVRAAFLSAVLAEYPNDLQYHGNEHYRKVLFHAIRLIGLHNRLEEHVLDHDRMALLLAASCIHDLGHQGGDNMCEGIYKPGYMEQRSTEIVRPYYEALGLKKDDVAAIEAMVFCTDITFFAGDNSPCVRMKKIFKHQFWGDNSEDVSSLTLGKLRLFGEDQTLTLMAMLLHEADIASSAGLSYEQTVFETVNIMAERGIDSAGPKTVLAFLREQLGETMFTQAGKQLFGRVMAEVIARAEKDFAEGRKAF